MRTSECVRVTLLSLLLIAACGGETHEPGPSSSGGAPVGGASTGGAATQTGGVPAGGMGGSAGVDAGAPGSGGFGAAQCDSVGCAPAPLCATGCPAECGCCPCAQGDATSIDGVKHECSGGCWAPVEAACTWEGQSHGAGAVFPAGDGCNECECAADGTVSCTTAECASCDPARERNQREYVAESPQECMLIDFDCSESTSYFSNECGCGCEQDASCPPYIDCMPGGAEPECADLEAFALRCPYSDVAW